MTTKQKDLKIFVYYAAPEDMDLCEQFIAHLSFFKRCRRFEICHYGNFLVGDDVPKTINKHLNSADLILLLVSKNFVVSERCRETMQGALERYARGEAEVATMLLEEFYTMNEPFERVRRLPANGIPLTRWHDRDQAFSNICISIDAMLLRIINIYERSDINNRGSKSYNDKKGTYDDETRRFFREEVRRCDEAIRFNPNDPAAYRKKGMALCELRNFVEAVVVLEKAIRLNPESYIDHL